MYIILMERWVQAIKVDNHVVAPDEREQLNRIHHDLTFETISSEVGTLLEKVGDVSVTDGLEILGKRLILHKRVLKGIEFGWTANNENINEEVEYAPAVDLNEESDVKEEATVAAKRKEMELVRSELMQKVDEHNLHKMGSARLTVLKDELMQTVDDHLGQEEEKYRMEMMDFKTELISTVDEHLQNLHQEVDKGAIVDQFKYGMDAKVDAHMRKVGLREKI